MSNVLPVRLHRARRNECIPAVLHVPVQSHHPGGPTMSDAGGVQRSVMTKWYLCGGKFQRPMPGAQDGLAWGGGGMRAVVVNVTSVLMCRAATAKWSLLTTTAA